MKHNLNKIKGYTIGATDGEIGKVKDFFFDDASWTIRYLVVETGSWLFGRKVLIAPEAIIKGEWANDMVPVNLTMEQIEKSPDIDTEKPVSRQQEIELYNHYPWTSYWNGGLGAGDLWAGGIGTTGMMMGTLTPLGESIQDRENAEPADEQPKGDPHLRSAANVKGYSIHATDDNIGEVEDYVFDDTTWTINYLIVDTGKLFPGKKVVISPKLIQEVSWETASVKVNVPTDQVKNSPAFESVESLGEDYDSNLGKHYKYTA